MMVEKMDTAPPPAAAAMLGERHWRLAAIALLSVRLIQGFIYWGGGSRRFIYDPEKLNPDALTRMANGLSPTRSTNGVTGARIVSPRGSTIRSPRGEGSAATGRIAAFAPPIRRQGVTPGG